MKQKTAATKDEQVMTIRVPIELHAAIKKQAYLANESMNQIVLNLIAAEFRKKK